MNRLLEILKLTIFSEKIRLDIQSELSARNIKASYRLTLEALRKIVTGDIIFSFKTIFQRK